MIMNEKTNEEVERMCQPGKTTQVSITWVFLLCESA
jgi:hypothetical protein